MQETEGVSRHPLIPPPVLLYSIFHYALSSRLALPQYSTRTG